MFLMRKRDGKMKFCFDACGFLSVIGLPNMAPWEEWVADDPLFASITITKAHLRFRHLPQTLAAKAKYSHTQIPQLQHTTQ